MVISVVFYCIKNTVFLVIFKKIRHLHNTKNLFWDSINLLIEKFTVNYVTLSLVTCQFLTIYIRYRHVKWVDEVISVVLLMLFSSWSPNCRTSLNISTEVTNPLTKEGISWYLIFPNEYFLCVEDDVSGSVCIWAWTKNPFIMRFLLHVYQNAERSSKFVTEKIIRRMID